MARRSRLNADLIQYYSHILISRTKRAGFIFMMVAVYVFMVLALVRHMMYPDQHWIYAAIPLGLLGVPLTLYPPIEHWVYRPWQAKAQKYERHYRD